MTMNSISMIEDIQMCAVRVNQVRYVIALVEHRVYLLFLFIPCATSGHLKSIRSLNGDREAGRP